MKNILFILGIILALCSCNKGEYVDAIPSTATALVAIDGYTPLLSDVEDLDTTKTVYLFELAGGDMGLCAMDTDGDPMIKFLSNDDHTAKLKDHMDDCDPDNNIRSSQLWKHLQETTGKNSSNSSSGLRGKMRMVAQTNVLPKQMQACMLLGAPKGTDPADVILEGELTYSDADGDNGTLTLTGHCSAYDTMCEQMLEHAFDNFRPITVEWQQMMQQDNLLGIFMNVEGDRFISLLQKNKALNMMLMSSNSIDKIRDNKGNMAIVGTLDNKWSVKTNMKPETMKPETSKLVMCLNMKSLPKELEEVIGFLTTKVKRIVYKVE